MGREFEIKLRIKEPEALRERLAACGRDRTARVERNTMLDTPRAELLGRDTGLRVRESREENGRIDVTVTFKGPREQGPVKVREEIETRVSDAASMIELLACLGLAPALVFEKRRETWAVDRCEVALDELPGLGWWVEIEGPDATCIEDVRRRLGLEGAHLVEMAYPELIAAVIHPDEDGVRRLVFL